jgi:ATP-binding cassette subfamily B protein
MKEILKFLKDPKILLLQALALILTIASNSVSLILPNQFSKLLDNFTKSNEIDSFVIILLIGSATAGLIVGIIQSYTSTYIAERIGYKIRNSLIKTLTSQTFKFINKETSGKLLTIFTSDISTVKDFLATGAITILSAVFMLIGSLILMTRINSQLTLAIFAIVPILLFGIFFVFRKAKDLFNASRLAQDSINKAIDENIKASMLVKVFVAERTEEMKFEHRNETSKITSLKIVNIFATLLPVFTLFTGLVTLIITWVGGSQIISGNLTLGELTAFTTYVTLFTTPIFIIGFLGSSIGQTINSASRISNILTAKNDFIQGEKEIDEFKNLEFKNVDFSYEDNAQTYDLLKKISFNIKKGEKVGIIGSSGSGKTLLMNLIMRFYDPIKGEILLNGITIQDYKINSYRDIVSLVPQENFIFSGTIKDNMRFGSEKFINEAELERIAKICDVYEFVMKFSNGFEEEAGERGATLSGGQKQRITIARALLHKPQILILDDSTSRLDIKTERRIMDSIKKEFPELTIIIVAQKVASLSWCDKIIVLEEGKIDEIGTHEQLLKESFIYKEIEVSQSNYNEHNDENI